SSDYYKASIKHENDVLFFEEMAKELFSKISVVVSNKYFENKSD
ncbi:19198_t:CDS:1, partial [Cetraspora pellucida]